MDVGLQALGPEIQKWNVERLYAIVKAVSSCLLESRCNVRISIFPTLWSYKSKFTIFIANAQAPIIIRVGSYPSDNLPITVVKI